jgi:hypothetical protein
LSVKLPCDGILPDARSQDILATASDTNGSITQVDFYEDGNLLYTDTTAPYSYSWNNVPTGSLA